MRITAADPPMDETLPSLAEVREIIKKLKGAKAARISIISAYMRIARVEIMIHGLHAGRFAVWQSGHSSCLKKGVGFPYLEWGRAVNLFPLRRSTS